MTDLATIEAELQDITARLSDAVEKIHAGITLDLSDLAPRTSVLCEQILQLPPELALSMLTRLQETVTQLDSIHAQIQ